MPKRIGFMPTAVLEDKILQLMEERGYSTKAQVIIEAIIQMYAKAHPAYSQSKPAGDNLDKKPISTEEKVKKQMETAELKKAAKYKLLKEEKVKICMALGGEVVTTDGGSESCRYYKYSEGERYQQEVPLTRVSNDLIDTQYTDKARELKLRSEGRVNYPLEK